MRPLTPFLISLSLFAFVARPSVHAEPVAAVRATQVSELFDAIARQLTDHFQSEGTLTLEAQRPWNPPASDSPVAVTVVEFPKELTSSLMLRVRLTSAGQVISEPTLLLRAQLMRDVYVSKSAVEREASFDIAQFETRAADVLRERDPVRVTDSLEDKVLARSFPAGRVLTRNDLTKRPLIRRGDLCEVAAIDGSMTIVLRAMAMENGSEGEVVKVRNVETRKEFNARVVAQNRAEIRF